MSHINRAQYYRLPVCLLSLWTGLGVCLLLAPPAVAQSSMGGFGNFGLGTESGFGSLGSNSGGGRGGQNNSSGMGSMGGQSGMGGMTGMGGTGQGMAMPSLGGGGALGSGFDAGFGATQMASSLATAAAVSRLTGASMAGRGGFGGGFGGGRGGFGGQGGFGGNNGNQNSQKENKVRAVIRIGFPVQHPTASHTAGRINQRFAAMPLPPGVAGVQVTMDGRTAVLQGQVQSLEDGGLLERLLLLEPGIDGVRNELSVANAGNPSEEVPVPAPQG